MGITLTKLNNPAIISFGVVIVAAGILTGVRLKAASKPNIKTYFGDKVYEICIKSFCARQDNGWVISEGDKKYPGDTDKLDQLAKQMSQVKLDTVASINKDKFAQMGFGDSSMTLKSNNKQLMVGNMTNSYDSTYVKVDDKVYEIPFVWNSSLYGDVGYWKNKTITNLPLYQIKKITISRNGKDTVVEPKDNKWPDDKFTEKAAHLTATDLLEVPKEGLGETLTLQIQTTDDKNTKIAPGEWKKSRKETLYWARDEKGDYYQISKDDFVLLTR